LFTIPLLFQDSNQTKKAFFNNQFQNEDERKEESKFPPKSNNKTNKGRLESKENEHKVSEGEVNEEFENEYSLIDSFLIVGRGDLDLKEIVTPQELERRHSKHMSGSVEGEISEILEGGEFEEGEEEENESDEEIYQTRPSFSQTSATSATSSNGNNNSNQMNQEEEVVLRCFPKILDSIPSQPKSREERKRLKKKKRFEIPDHLTYFIYPDTDDFTISPINNRSSSRLKGVVAKKSPEYCDFILTNLEGSKMYVGEKNINLVLS